MYIVYPIHPVCTSISTCSMGGAIAVRVAATKGLIPSLVGLVVIDVVEGCQFLYYIVMSLHYCIYRVSS